MIIVKCDICDATITPQEENGKLVYIEKTFQVFKNKQEPAVKQYELVFCEKCIRGLRSYIHGQRDVNKK